MCVCASMCVKRAKEFPFLASSRVCNSQRSSGEADKCLPTLRPTSDIINIATVSKCRTFRTASGGAVNTDAGPRRTSPFFPFSFSSPYCAFPHLTPRSTSSNGIITSSSNSSNLPPSTAAAAAAATAATVR